MQIRTATSDDVPLILSFIKKKAAFDRGLGAFSDALLTSESKIHKTIFGRHPYSYVLFAELSNRPVGFALYAFRYSSYAGQPSIWLDDLYVDEAIRSQGVGAALMDRLAQVAEENDCTHLGWSADAQNTRGMRFYQRIGAEVIEQRENRCELKWIPDSLSRRHSTAHEHP